MSGPSLFDADPAPPRREPVSIPASDRATAEPTAAPANVDLGPSRTRSLYRKYRPQTFDAADLVGQEHVVQTLRNAILLDRIAHAYLFCGPRGTGKTTTARLLAKAVNCLDPDAMRRPCNDCTNCRAVAAGTATDVIEIDAASNRGIDDIRELRERVKYAPAQLRVKFYIIDEAHQITGAAANAFLKTLEEPPGHTKFVLATTDPEELLPTIVSRCQRFDFRRIGLDATVARLRTVAAAENLAVDDDALMTIARHATGSLRDALGLLDQLAVYREGPNADAGGSEQPRGITADAVRALLGVSRNDRVETLVAALADRDPSLALGTVNAAVEAGEDPRQLNRQLVAYLRTLLHERAGGSPDADERARALAARFELLELAELARRFGDIDYKIKHSPYGQLPLEVALVEGILRGQRLPSTGTPARSASGAGSGEAGAPAGMGVEQDSKTIPNGVGPAVPPATGGEVTDIPDGRPATTLRDRVRWAAPGADRPIPGVDQRVVREASPTMPPPPHTAGDAPPARERPATPAPAVAPVSPAHQTDRVDGVANGAGPELDVERLADLWPRIRQDVKAVNRRIEALLSSIDPLAVHGDAVTLAAAYEFHRDKLNTTEVRLIVEEAIGRLVGERVRVTCVLRGEAATAPVSAATTVHRPAHDTGPAARAASPSDLPPPEPGDANSEQEPAIASATLEPVPPADLDADERRLQAAKNIFDAEEIS